MEGIWQGFLRAINLLVTLDPEVIEITIRTLAISISSCIISAIICIPLGSLIHFKNFPGKRILINIIQTFYSIPTVVVGLLVYLFFSSAGPLGIFELMFTPAIMVIGQVILISPIIVGLVIAALSSIAVISVLKEAKYAIYSAVILGFGRAISEVGLALMVGGNIRGFTRVITTAISLETSKGDLELSLALGMILIVIALIINLIVNRFQQRS